MKSLAHIKYLVEVVCENVSVGDSLEFLNQSLVLIHLDYYTFVGEKQEHAL